MPRTLPAALTTAMDSGNYVPYIRVHINSTSSEAGEDTFIPLAFTLGALEAEIRVEKTDAAPDEGYFRIERGAMIDGSPVTISSMWFTIVEFIVETEYIIYKGDALSRDYLVIDAGSDYETVIDTALVSLGADTHTIVANYEGTALWKAYQFYPDGKSIVLSLRKKLFTLLQQKYLIFATDDGWDGTQSNMFFFVATQTRSVDYTITDPLVTFNFHTEIRKLIWRDEAGTVHTVGDDENPLYNLGYLESTAADPIDLFPNNQAIGTKTRKLPVHLKYRTGDMVTIRDGDPADFNTSRRIKVTEVFDRKSTPSWYQVVEVLVFFSATEGGPLPSTIEAAAPYTPLVTGNFDGILDANDNNIQTAMETIDDHGHADTYSITLPAHGLNGVVSADGEKYAPLYYYGLNSVGYNFTITKDGTLKNLSVSLNSAQPGTGTLVATVYVENAASALVLTIPAGSGLAVYEETATDVSVSAGDRVIVHFKNNAATNSGLLGAIALELEQTLS